MALWLCLAAIAISIFLGWKFNYNTGVIAMVFAFFIGYFCLDMSVNKVISLFPVTIVFYIIIISLFFNYATNNGTMDVLGKKLLYALGGNAKLVPWVTFLIAIIIAMLGAGSATPIIIGPFVFVVALSAGVDPTLTAVAITLGNLIGGSNPFNGYAGVIGQNLIMDNGVAPDTAMRIGLYLLANEVMICVLLFVVFYFLYKGYKGQKVSAEKPEGFNETQRKTLILLIISFFFMIVPSLLNVFVPTPFTAKLAGICQPQVIMAIGAVLCAFLKVGSEREALKAIPINTVVMITGVYMLVKVAAAAGLIDAVSTALSSSIPKALVPGAIVLFAAFLSFFSSSTSTVMPLMFPLVPTLASTLGLNPVMLYFCVFFGGFSTACSPFSTGGSVVIAACPDNASKERLSKTLIVCAGIMPAITILCAEIGLFNFFRL